MTSKKQSIFTDASLEVSELLKQVREEIRKFAPEPFMKRRITKAEADRITQQGGNQWQDPGM